MRTTRPAEHCAAPSSRHSIPVPMGPYLQRVLVGCFGRIPFSTVPAAFALASWALDGVSQDERDAYDVAARQWSLTAAFACVGDVTRHLMFQPEIYARRGDANE